RTERISIGPDRGFSNTCSRFRGACRRTCTRCLARMLLALAGSTSMLWLTIHTGTAWLTCEACKTGTCDISLKLYRESPKLLASADLYASIKFSLILLDSSPMAFHFQR